MVRVEEDLSALGDIIRRVAIGCTEDRHVVRRVEEGAELIMPKPAWRGELKNWKATRKGHGNDNHRQYLLAARREGGDGEGGGEKRG